MIFYRLAGQYHKQTVPSVIPMTEAMALPVGVGWAMDFIPTSNCYKNSDILTFKEKQTAYLHPDELKSSKEWYDAVVRLKSFVWDTRGVQLRILYADCGSQWTNTHVCGNGNPGSAEAKRLYDEHCRRAWRPHLPVWTRRSPPRCREFHW